MHATAQPLSVSLSEPGTSLIAACNIIGQAAMKCSAPSKAHHVDRGVQKDRRLRLVRGT